jgi:catechol-2,3-dioxygenase
MPIIGINHYNLRAARDVLDALRDFYIDIVGMQIGLRPLTGSFGYWLYIGDQAVLHLSEVKDGEVRHSFVQGTFDHVSFTTTDLPQMLAHLEAKGIQYHRQTVPATGQVQLFFSDPAGNGVELNFAPPL